jgi:hypothetical protein
VPMNNMIKAVTLQGNEKVAEYLRGCGRERFSFPYRCLSPRIGRTGRVSRSKNKPDGGGMEIEYSLTLEDVRAFTFNQAKRSADSLPKNATVGSLIIGALVPTWIVSLFVEDPQTRWVLHIVSLLLLGAWVGVILAALNMLRVIAGGADKQFKDPQNRFLFESRRLSIASEGMTIISEWYRDYLSWQIVDVVVTAGHVFFYNGSTNAQVVPKRAFRDEQHFKEFVQLALHYHEVAAEAAGIVTALPEEAPARSTNITRDIQ